MAPKRKAEEDSAIPAEKVSKRKRQDKEGELVVVEEEEGQPFQELLVEDELTWVSPFFENPKHDPDLAKQCRAYHKKLNQEYRTALVDVCIAWGNYHDGLFLLAEMCRRLLDEIRVEGTLDEYMVRGRRVKGEDKAFGPDGLVNWTHSAFSWRDRFNRTERPDKKDLRAGLRSGALSVKAFKKYAKRPTLLYRLPADYLAPPQTLDEVHRRR